jgi:tetratricopeptide (TPR) repeat protein
LLPGRINSVSGVVLAGDGKPLSDVRVEIRREDTGTTIVSGYTNDYGVFGFDHLPMASYELVATRGLEQARQHLTLVDGGEANLKIRLNTGDAAARADGAATVSVAEYKVPQKARDAFHKAQEAMVKNQYDEAKKQLTKSLDAYPDYAPALTLRGVLTLDEGSTQSAMNDFDHAIHSDPGFSLAYTAMAAVLNQLGKFDDALRSAGRAVTLAPTAWQAYFEMAQASVGKADYSNALQHLAKAQRLASKDFPPIHLVRAHAMLGLRDYSNAVTELEAFIKLAPHDPNSSAARESLERAKALTAAAASRTASGTPK